MHTKSYWAILCLTFTLAWVLLACNKPTANQSTNQKKTENLSKGKLCVIGGGEMADEIIEVMISESGIGANDYVAVLPMSSSEPDSSFFFFNQDMNEVAQVRCINLNFEEKDIINTPKLDSLKNAKFIFITGGDQNRFMTLVKDTPIQEAITDAYSKGALIGGSSAGAAVLSQIMITGNENFSPEYAGTYDKVWQGNAIYSDGLGLIKNVIIDQHFIVRSRFNRMLSALCDHNGNIGLGIDEETAVLISGDSAKVYGNSQVAVFDALDTCGVYFKHNQIRNLNMNLYTSGDSFLIP